jgi:two-component system chemotaxis response regulator CheY
MGKTVLVVDDSASVRQVVSIALKGAGYDVIQGSDGKDALKQLDGRRIHLIISDVNMPNMDGITFAREARKALRFTPILMLTTESEQTKRAEAKTAGATGWLVKPVAPDQLLGVIKQVLPGA